MSLLRVRVTRETPVTGAFEWARYDDGGALLDTGADGPAGATASSESQTPMPGVSGTCELVIPAELVLLERIATPAAQRERLAAALRFLVEDNIAVDPERIHVAAESAPGKDNLAVGVIDRQWFAQVLARLRRVRLDPRAAYPEPLLVPRVSRAWAVVWNGTDGFARSGTVEGFALDRSTEGKPPVALALALDKARSTPGTSPPERVIVHAATGGGATRPDAKRWSAGLGVPVEFGPPWHWHESLRVRRRPQIDLLQGEFAPGSAGEDWMARLRRPALLAGALLAVMSIGLAADWNAKARERDILRGEMRAIYRESFGQSAVVVDAPLQMRRALFDLRARTGQIAPSDFIALMRALGDRLLDPATQRLEAIEYDKGVLSLTLRPLDPAQSATVFDALRAKTLDSGLEVRAETAGSENDPRIRLTARAREHR